MSGRDNTLSELRARRRVYQSVGAKSAALASLLAFLLAGWIWKQGASISNDFFFFSWMAVAVAVDLVSGFQLFRQAKKEGQPVPSDRMILSALLMLPPFLVGLVLSSIFLFFYEDPVNAAIYWAICSGLGLLTLSAFLSKKSIFVSAAILVCGLGFLIFRETGGPLPGEHATMQGAVVMAVCFGVPLALFSATAWRTQQG